MEKWDQSLLLTWHCRGSDGSYAETAAHYAAHDRNPYAFEVCDAAKKMGGIGFGYPARI
jgi:hypothetical protein